MWKGSGEGGRKKWEGQREEKAGWLVGEEGYKEGVVTGILVGEEGEGEGISRRVSGKSRVVF